MVASLSNFGFPFRRCSNPKAAEFHSQQALAVMGKTDNFSRQANVLSNASTFAYARRGFHLAVSLNKGAQKIDSENGGCLHKVKNRVNIGLIDQLITGWDG